MGWSYFGVKTTMTIMKSKLDVPQTPILFGNVGSTLKKFFMGIINILLKMKSCFTATNIEERRIGVSSPKPVPMILTPGLVYILKTAFSQPKQDPFGNMSGLHQTSRSVQKAL